LLPARLLQTNNKDQEKNIQQITMSNVMDEKYRKIKNLKKINK
jgi:hypothetical protein